MMYLKQLRAALPAIILFSAIVFTSPVATGEEKYKIISNDPGKFYNNSFEPALRYTYSRGGTLSLGVTAESFVVKGIAPHISGFAGILDAPGLKKFPGSPDAKGGRKSTLNFDMGVTFFVYAENRKKTIPIALEDWQFTYGESVRVPSQTRMMAGPAMGLCWYRKPVRLNAGDESIGPVKFRYESLDGTAKFPLEDYSALMLGGPAGLPKSPTTMAYCTYAYIGGDMRYITNTVVDVEGYGERNNTAITDYYIHILVATSNRVSNVVDDSAKEWKLSGTNNTAYKNLGVRVGYRKCANKNSGITWGIESGYLPGISGQFGIAENGAFMSAFFGYAIKTNRKFFFGKNGTKKPLPKEKSGSII